MTPVAGLLSYWRRQSPLKAPSDPHSHVHDARLDVKFIGPILKALSLATKGKHAIAAGIARLLRISSPFTIAWLVSLVIVDSVNGVLVGWPRPHVRNEICKVTPSVAHRDSTSTVPLVSRAFWITAPLKHCIPDAVFLRPVQPVPDMDDGTVSLEAAARTAFAFSQASAIHIPNYSAFAKTFPESTSGWPQSGVAYDSPSAKHHAVNVFDVPRERCNIAVSHETFLCTEGRLWIEPTSTSLLAGSNYYNISQRT